MKKLLSFCLVVSLIVSSVLVKFSLTVFADDESSIITVSDINSFLDAVYDVADGGTVKIDGDIVVPASSSPFIIGSDWEKKTFTITGGSLDFSGLTSGDGEKGFVILGENVIFDDVKLVFDSERNDYLFASGYQLTIKESVIFEGAAVCLYGGSYLHGSYPNNKGDRIDITLLAGKYTTINGTSHGSGYSVPGDVFIHVGGSVTANTILGNSGGCTVPGNINVLVDGNASVNEVRGSGNSETVNGNVYVTIGGNANVKMTYGGGSSGTVKGNTYVIAKDNANLSCNASSHDMTYAIFGGGYGGTIEGSTNVLFTDNAKANYIWGGCKSGGEVLGGTNITMSGGQTMSMYGGGYGVAQNCDATVTLTGGTLEQVFGGCQSQSFTGDITVKLLGGTVKRRVFGGCYNDASRSGFSIKFSTSYFVTGSITLIIDSDATVDYSYDAGGILAAFSNDHALSAHSRREAVESNEKASIIYVDADAKAEFASKIKVGNASKGNAYDYIHCYAYTINENVISKTCSEHSDYSATATLTVPTDAIYNGSAYEITIDYSENWEFGAFEVTHTDNINAGEAYAKLSMLGKEIYSVGFTIGKAAVSSPSVSAKNETVKGKGDCDIIGVTTDMEYSLDGTSYTKISATDMTWSVGMYYFRYSETDNYLASEPIAVEVCEGEQLKVVFMVDGEEYDVKYLDWNETLEDIPAVPEKDGYTAKWDKNEFVDVTEDVVVNAVYELIPVITPEPEETTTAFEDLTEIEETTVEEDLDKEETTEELVAETESETTVDEENTNAVESDTDVETSYEEESEAGEKETIVETVTDAEESTDAITEEEKITETEKNETSRGGCGGTVNGIAIILTVFAAIPVFNKKKRSNR